MAAALQLSGSRGWELPLPGHDSLDREKPATRDACLSGGHTRIPAVYRIGAWSPGGPLKAKRGRGPG